MARYNRNMPSLPHVVRARRTSREVQGLCLDCGKVSPVAGKRLCVRCRNSRLRSDRKRKYGLTEKQIAEMSAEQANACAICRAVFQDVPRVDHDHRSNQIRGLLCAKCNKGLGHFDDSIQLLFAAARYLSKYTKIGVAA